MRSLTYLDVTSNSALGGTIPELLHNRALVGLLDLKNDGTLVPPTTVRTCEQGLDLYLPYLVRTHGSGNTFAVDCKVVDGASPMGGTIPEWIGVFTGLTRLYLVHNNMVGTLPSGLGLLTNLDNM
jgi:hypothetical protein